MSGKHESLTADEFKALIASKAKPAKYRNKRSGGFDSKREEKRYYELAWLEAQGAISALRRQVRYKLAVNDQLICAYVADFVYEEMGKEVVEDCKGFRTREYKLKRKLMKAVHGIEIRES